MSAPLKKTISREEITTAYKDYLFRQPSWTSESRTPEQEDSLLLRLGSFQVFAMEYFADTTTNPTE